MKGLSKIKHYFKRYFPIMSTIIFGILLVIFILRLVYTRPQLIASIIYDDITLISMTLEKVDVECNILSLEHDRNYVDFLNVERFAGSRVGPINLVHPKNWKGPYVRTSPTIQEKFYEIVKAKDGVYVVPGQGVTLPSGKVMGTDITISRDTVVAELLKNDGFLMFKDIPLAVRLSFTIGDWDSGDGEKRVPMTPERLQEIERYLREFNQAMPFTKNDMPTYHV